MALHPAFECSVLQRICDVLAHTDNGLTGSQISGLLSQLGIDDPLLRMTKRHRLFEALRQRQHADRWANNVIAFIHEAMRPVRHTGSPERFHLLRDDLNTVLAFAGYEGRDLENCRTRRHDQPGRTES